MITTSIVVTARMAPDQIQGLFEHARTALADASRVRGRRARNLRVQHGPSDIWPGNRMWHVLPGQGLAGRLRVLYGPGGGPLVDQVGDLDLTVPAGTYVYVDLSSYGGCGPVKRGEVHARFVREVTAWLTRARLPWQWQFEDRGWQRTAANVDRIIPRNA